MRFGSGAVWLSSRAAFLWRARDLGEPRESGVPIAPAFGVMGWRCVAFLATPKSRVWLASLLELHHYLPSTQIFGHPALCPFADTAKHLRYLAAPTFPWDIAENARREADDYGKTIDLGRRRRF